MLYAMESHFLGFSCMHAPKRCISYLYIAIDYMVIDRMLVFTKLLVIFAAMLLIFSVAFYFTGYYFSGTTSLVYYPSGSSYNFIQNGATTLKYFGIFLSLIGLIAIIGATINEHLELSAKLHHLKKFKPLH